MNQFWDRFVTKDRRKLRLRMLQTENPKNYFPLSQRTPYFQKIMNKYNKMNKRNVNYHDINTLLADYREDKIKSLTDAEVMREEIGSEIKKYRELQKLPHQAKSDIKNLIIKKGKENRKNLLISLERFEKRGKLIIPDWKKRKELTSELNPNKILYPPKIFHYNTRNNFLNKTKDTLKSYNSIDEKEKSNTYIDFRTTLHQLHNKIDNMANDVENESRMLKTTYKNNIEIFSNDFDEWKKTQEFRYPWLIPKKY